MVAVRLLPHFEGHAAFTMQIKEIIQKTLKKIYEFIIIIIRSLEILL